MAVGPSVPQVKGRAPAAINHEVMWKNSGDDSAGGCHVLKRKTKRQGENSMRRILALLALAAVAVFWTACGGGGNTNNTRGTNNNKNKTTTRKNTTRGTRKTGTT